MKKFWRNIHLYLSLAAGLVIMVVCFTGAMLVFEKEFQQEIYPERYFVEAGPQRLSLDSVIQKFKLTVKGVSVSGIKLYTDPKRSIEVSYAEKIIREDKIEFDNKNAGKQRSGDRKPDVPRNKQAFVNPYSGELICLYDSRSSFFFTMFSIHRWLLLGDVGKLIVGISTIVFLFIIITGLILWWPKTRSKLKQHLTLKWSGWKRINHDLHVVIGFYTAIFLFAFAFTGLAWSFEWFNNGIYWVTGSEKKRLEPPISIYQPLTNSVAVDKILTTIQKITPDPSHLQINLPKDSTAVYAVTVMTTNSAHERASDQYFLDQYTGEVIGTSLYHERNLGQRVRSTFYPIHVGSIGGLPGRIIAFLSCIAGFTFPVTGLILWLNRLKKERNKFRKQKMASKHHAELIVEQ